MRKWLTMLVSILILIGSPGKALADWQLYDNFSSGSFDSNKWIIDDSSATIIVESGRAKFVHHSGHASDSSWLEFKNPGRIIGIKATVTVESCAGDARARIGGFLGKDGENSIWAALGIRADRDFLSAELPILGPAPDYEYQRDYYWGRFKRPQTIVGSTFTISILFNRKQSTFSVEDDGALSFTFLSTLTPPDNLFKGIGTRSNDGSGACTVYFDDVYVLRKPGSAAVNLLLLD
jgi:hypothetical protein